MNANPVFVVDLDSAEWHLVNKPGIPLIGVDLVRNVAASLSSLQHAGEFFAGQGLGEAAQKIQALERELALARAHDSQPYPTADAYEKVCAVLNETKTRSEFLERTLREHLWLNHGHEGLYGDDGEMQCAACIPYSVSDYKRQPVEELLAGLRNLAIHRLAKPT